VNKEAVGFARLSGLAKEILDSYVAIRDATPAAVVGEIWNTNPLLGYFAVRRAAREKILGTDQVRSSLKSSDYVIVFPGRHTSWLSCPSEAGLAERILSLPAVSWVSLPPILLRLLR